MKGKVREEEEEAVKRSGISERILIKKECKCLFCVIAEKWLKRNYIVDVIEKEERERKNCK